MDSANYIRRGHDWDSKRSVNSFTLLSRKRMSKNTNPTKEIKHQLGMNFTELKKKLRFVHNNTYLLNKAKSGTQISLGSKCTRSTSSYWLAFHVRNSLFQFWKWQEIFQSWQSVCQMVLSNFYHSGKYQRSIFSGKPNRARWAIKYLLPPNFPHTLQPPSTPPPLKKESERASLFSINWYF